MSEQKQRPPVWLIWDSGLDCWVDNVFRDRHGAEFVSDGDDVVEMIPREPDGRAELVAALRRIAAMDYTRAATNGMGFDAVEIATDALRKAGET